MPRLDEQREHRLIGWAEALIDQHRATVAVAPQASAPGFWFGGGNLVADPAGGFWLVGRYRNHGDSRTGLAEGQRGLELALFHASEPTGPFRKAIHFHKQDLDIEDRRVLSIEGSALHWTDRGVELFVSTEKSGIGYPDPLESYLKPNTGVWTIERLVAPSVEGLREARPTTMLESRDPCFLHLKDPVVYDPPGGGLVLLFCTHPFCWSSSNSAYARRLPGEEVLEPPCFDFFPRGCAWDVAMSRITAVLDVPRVGAFQDLRVSLVFYDGGECVRNLEEHATAVRRPRGYSCEELGGVAYFCDGDLHDIHRLSRTFPLLVSPHGTGCSRYVDVLNTGSQYGSQYVATWQQGHPDGSQPLMIHALPRRDVERLLGA